VQRGKSLTIGYGEKNNLQELPELNLLVAMLECVLLDIKKYNPNIKLKNRYADRRKLNKAIEAVDYLLDDSEEAYSSNHICDTLKLNKKIIIKNIKKQDKEKWVKLINARNADITQLEKTQQWRSGVNVEQKWI